MRALSVRQPWAWAIVFAGKDIENRSQAAIKHMFLPCRERIRIHASKGMTAREYVEARDFMASIGVTCPDPAALIRGAVIGSVDVLGVVKESDSRWFFGPRGLLLARPEPCPVEPGPGRLSLFEWGGPIPGQSIMPPAKWMRLFAARTGAAAAGASSDLPLFPTLEATP